MNKIFDALIRGHNRRSAIRYLESMDDRMLRDIGLGRGDISEMIGARQNGRRQ